MSISAKVYKGRLVKGYARYNPSRVVPGYISRQEHCGNDCQTKQVGTIEK